MNCPHCNVPLMRGMTSCPKCKYDINTADGGPKHKEWLYSNSPTALEAKKKEEEKVKQLGEEVERRARNMLLTTCPSLEGYRVTAHYGLVFGEIAFKTGLFKSLGASFDNFFDMLSVSDTELSGTSKLLDNSREYAIKKMKIAAAKMGANAVIGIDSESSVGGDVMHVTIYGTAVSVERIY